MFTYKNTTYTKKKFYGVTFNPGETHDVPGFVNDPGMIKVISTHGESKPVQYRKPPEAASKSKSKQSTSANSESTEVVPSVVNEEIADVESLPEEA